MLSKSERKFTRDWIKIKGGCTDEFREKWSYDYERILWYRIKKKYPKILRDLMLLMEVLSSYDRNDLFHDYILNDETRGDEDEAQRLISFEMELQEMMKAFRKREAERKKVENNEKV